MKEIFYCSIKLIAHKILSCHDINGRVGRLDFKVGLSFRVFGFESFANSKWGQNGIFCIAP